MKKLDQYMLKSFIGPFVAILLVVLFVLLLQFLWLYIDELVGKGLGFGVILEFMMWGACTILPTAMPLAVLLSAVMVMGQLGENKELMAIKASGISLGRVFAPLIAAAFVISVGAFFIGNNLVSRAYNEIFTLRDDITHTKESIKIPSGTFYEGIEGYVLRVEDQNDESGMMYKVQVYDHTARKGNTSLIVADSALLKMSKQKDYLIFTLYSGSNYQENNRLSYRDTSLALNRVDFSRQELIIHLSNYTFEHSDSSRFGDQAKSMRYMQLKAQSDSLSQKNAEAFETHYKRMRTSTPFSYRNQLDTARRGDLTALYSSDKMWKWNSLEDINKAYEKAAGEAERVSSDVMGYNHDIYQSTFYLRRTDIELYKKIAQALACFIFFFIGAPLGAMIKKGGGLGISAIISVFFFVIYWIVLISGEKLAKDGSLSAFNGDFAAAYVLAPIGIFLTYKAVKDAELFNMDTVKSGWRRFWSIIWGFFHKPRIVYMGTPEFAVAPLDELVTKGYKVVGVVTVADKPSGRGLKVNESAVKQYAVEHGIPVLQPVKLRDPEFLKQLAAFKADLFVVVAFRMLPEEVWKMPRLGTFNLHASLLPQYRGAAPINWAIINGERRTGVTTFMIDHNIDTGGIILREECMIEPDDDAGTLHDKLMVMGRKAVTDTVDMLVERNVELRMQRSFVQGSEVLHPAPKLTRDTCRLDWTLPAKDLVNLVRGLSPYPTAFTEIAPATAGIPSEDCGRPWPPEGQVSPGGQQGDVFISKRWEGPTSDSAVGGMSSVGAKSAEGIPAKATRAISMKIFKAEKMEMADAEPGRIYSDGKTYLAVGCADGAVSIKNLQMEGKKRMDVGAFLLGFRNPESWRCC